MDIKKILASKTMKLIFAIGAALAAYNAKIEEQQREAEFEDMKERLSKLEKK